MWLKKFVSGVRVVDNIERPLKLYYDNKPVVLYTHNNMKTKAAKHINIRFYVVKEKVQDQTISLEHISTKKIIVDPLTKGLPPTVFREHLAGMGLRESL
jgi:SPX domain protein involved in polyphosphate accumulation